MQHKKTTKGLINNKLAPCPDSPNCVSSESNSTNSKVEPIRFTGPPDAAWINLINAVKETGGMIKENNKYYLWAVYASKIFRFKDDLECRMNSKNNVIEVRSASRIGYSDFGVNRRRVNVLREKFNTIQNINIESSSN